MKILLPMDESPYSQAALRVIVSQFNKRGAHVRVLHVVEPVAVYVTAGIVPEFVESHPEVERERREQGKALVARTAKKLRQAGFAASEGVEFGDAKAVILDQAKKWNADLIVMGSHGLKGLGRFLMGSVSDAVIRHAACSVQIVRSGRPKK
jgi:nucleotide-binding universal stress UspA family protein